MNDLNSLENTSRCDTRSAKPFLVLSVAILGVALQITNGFNLKEAPSESQIALLLLVVSFAFCTLATLRPAWLQGTVSSRVTSLILHIALLGQFALLLRSETSQNAPLKNAPDGWVFQTGIVFAALLVLWPKKATISATVDTRTSSTQSFDKLRLIAVLLTFLVLGAWTIGHLRTQIGSDVVTVQHDSARALLQGVNPYGITFADPYNRDMTLYKPEHIANGRLLFGYVYPPLSLLMVLPGMLLGDIRFALLVFLAVSGALIGFMRPEKPNILIAALWLFTPRIFFAIVVGWTEAMLCAMLALTVFWAARQREKSTSLAFGLLLALKQYTFFLLPLSTLLTTSKIEYSLLIKRALGVIAVVSLPMILWNPNAFFHSAIRLNFTLPFRLDALNVTVWIARATGFIVPTFVGFLLAVIAVFVALKRCLRTPFDFASATAWVYFVFFLFGRQGFANYYFFVMCAMCCALAVLETEPQRHQDAESNEYSLL